MNASSLSYTPSFFEETIYSCRPIIKWAESKTNDIKRILDKHTDVISNLGILVTSTCLLAAKIFEQTPKFLPRIANFVYNYGVIIWLNVQVRDFMKSLSDFSRAIQIPSLEGMIDTAAKIFVKGTNIILTCAMFTGAVISAIAIPEAYLTVALAIRSFSLTCLVINILCDVRDYFANETLLKRLDIMEADPNGSVMVGKVMCCFLEIVKNVETPSKMSSRWNEEWRLADRLVRQLDNYTFETFKESLEVDRKEKNSLVDALKLFYGVIDGMKANQAYTKANLTLTALGYVSMAICKAFPDSLIETSTRWGMSVLYTDEFIQRKFFQLDLAERINGDY